MKAMYKSTLPVFAGVAMLISAAPANATCADKIDGHATVNINIPGDYEIQKIDGQSTAQISAVNIHLCQKIDGKSDAVITASSNISIDQKIDGHSTAQLIADSGSIRIGSGRDGDKIDGHSEVWIRVSGSVDIEGKIDGHSDVTIHAGGPITISGKIDGASVVSWCAPSAPAVGGSIDGNAKVVRLSDCPPDHLWDLVQSNFGLDPNGFFRMPNWKWASPRPPTLLHDVCDECPCREGTFGLDAPEQTQEWLTSSSCTHGPIHENSNNLCSGDIAKLQGGSGIGYHMIWAPVEYEGFLQWSDHSNWLTDNEYSFNIRRPDPADLALVTRGREDSGVHIEFSADETVDEWDDSCTQDGTCTWWKHFHHDIVDPKNDDQIRDELGSRFAVVIGMLGLDVAHPDHHAELHPAYAMFINLGPVGPNVRSPDHWAFFVKNWGSEGYCGHDPEPLSVDHIDVQLPVSRIITSNVFSYRHGQNHDACKLDPGAEIDPNGVLRFHLRTPDMKCGYVGDLIADPLPLTILLGQSQPPREARSREGLEGDPRLLPKIAKLSPSDQQQLNNQLAALMRESRSGPAVDRIQVIQRTSPLPRSEAFVVTDTNVKAASDPSGQQLEERKRQLIEEFVKAHGIQ